jgi:hypothetical protein
MPTDTLEPIVPRIHAEAGFEEAISPLRISGFISLVLGLLSSAALLNPVMLGVPLAALGFGFFALRRYSGSAPVGVRPAMVGIVLAAGFGACGGAIPLLKHATLGSQAKQFSRDFLEVVARENLEFAKELTKDYNNRFPTNMALEDHYQEEGAIKAMQEFKGSIPLNAIVSRGKNAEWILFQPVRIYYSRGKTQAEVVWADPAQKTKIQFFMHYKVDHRNGDGQWYVETCQHYREPIVAPAIL